MQGDIATYFEAVFFFVYGSILGSFFNVLIYRLPAKESIMFPASHCPKCGNTLSALENIPILSWLFLRGKCSNCKSKISIQYPLIELATAILSLLSWYILFNPFFTPDRAFYLYIPELLQLLTILILIPITIIDIRHFIIPDSITLGGLSLAILAAFIPEGITPLSALIGILAGGGTLYLIGIIGSFAMKKEAMGGGDIKLMAFVGALWGWEVASVAIMVAAFAGTIAGGVMMLLKKLDEDHKIPFGPYLAFGIIIALFWGESLLNWYLKFINY